MVSWASQKGSADISCSYRIFPAFTWGRRCGWVWWVGSLWELPIRLAERWHSNPPLYPSAQPYSECLWFPLCSPLSTSLVQGAARR